MSAPRTQRRQVSRGPEPAFSEPPGSGSRSPLLPLLAGLVLAGLVALAVWLLLVRDGDREAAPLLVSGEVSISVAVVDFGDEDVGGRSATQPVTLANGTSEAIRVEDVTVEGAGAEEFGVVEDGCLSARLESGDACTVTVRFRPERPGERGAQLVFSLEGGPGVRAVELTGAGVGGAAPLATPARVDFGAVEVGSRSPPRTVTIANLGSAPLEIRRISLAGGAADDFQVVRRDGCPAAKVVEAASSCGISVSFAPSQPEARSATLAVEYAGRPETARIALRGSGAGLARPEVAPDVLQLGRAEVGSTGSAGAVTVRNTGSAALVVTWISVVGGDAGDFELLDGACSPGQELAAGASCTPRVRFAPRAAGPRRSTLVIATDAPGPFLEVVVRGTGREPPSPPAVEPSEIAPPPATETQPQAEGDPPG